MMVSFHHHGIVLLVHHAVGDFQGGGDGEDGGGQWEA